MYTLLLVNIQETTGTPVKVVRFATFRVGAE
jgi:hypothetical protein